MAINRKCPKCGSEKVQLSNVKGNSGLLKFIFFGGFYLMWIFTKWCIGATLLVVWDSWNFILASKKEVGYVWQSKKWFALNKHAFFCHECAYNFTA